MLLPKRSTRSSMNVPRANSLPLLHVPDVFDSPPTSPNDSVSTVTTLTADVDNDSISISSSAVNRANFESKKSRRKLTTSQVHTLERLAVRDERPSLEVRRRLAEELQLELRVVSVWFQNRRRPTNAAKLRGVTATAHWQSLKNVDSTSEERQPRIRQPLKDTNVDIINVSPTANSAAADLWKHLPSSSPVRHNTAPPFLRKGPAPKKGSLEWACSKLSRVKKRVARSYNKTKAGGTTAESSTESQQSIASVKNELDIPQQVWDEYGRDAVEVAMVLVKMRYGEV